jgi:hypothetical protein
MSKGAMGKGFSSPVALLAAVLVLSVAACTAAPTNTATTNTATTGAAESNSASTEQPSAILVQPIHDAQVVPGDDGKDHVEYELMVVNVYLEPVTLTSVTVLDPAGKELGRIDGDTLAAATQALLTRAPTPEIAPSAAVAVDVDLALEPGTAPERVTHRIDYAVPDPTRAVTVDIGETLVNGPEVAIDRRAPIEIAPPLTGDGWMVSNGCCAPNVHRDLRLAINGDRIGTPETFAIDWSRVKNDRIYDGDGSQNEQHYAFGADILAVADATVVIVQDGEPEQVPNVRLVPQKSTELAGNLVVLEVEPNVYAAYVHLQPGSITVKVGDKVTVGQQLAHLGNSGNSSGPHLHFGLLDQANLFTGRSLPFVLEQFTLVGNVNFETSTGDHLVIAPKSKEVTRAYPLYGGILNFPGN